MLTVKHVHSLGSSIRQALEVREAEERGRRVIYADMEGDSTAEFDGGVIYVMNDAGATVAKYDLGDQRERRQTAHAA